MILGVMERQSEQQLTDDLARRIIFLIISIRRDLGDKRDTSGTFYLFQVLRRWCHTAE